MMEFFVGQSVQILDEGIWRNGEIEEINDSKYKIHFKNFSKKYDDFYSAGILKLFLF